MVQVQVIRVSFQPTFPIIFLLRFARQLSNKHFHDILPTGLWCPRFGANILEHESVLGDVSRSLQATSEPW